MDPHPLSRHGAHRLLSDLGHIVCWEADDGAMARDALDRTTPDLLLYEPAFDGPAAFEFLAYLKNHSPVTRVVIITMSVDHTAALRFLKEGVIGVISKRAGLHELNQALKKAPLNHVHVSPMVMEPAKSFHFASIQSLTRREVEVLRLVGLGHKAADIASKLGISPRTVDAHKQHIKDKLSLPGNAGLAAVACEWLRYQ